jgi:hypothetical protein
VHADQRKHHGEWDVGQLDLGVAHLVAKPLPAQRPQTARVVGSLPAPSVAA